MKRNIIVWSYINSGMHLASNMNSSTRLKTFLGIKKRFMRLTNAPKVGLGNKQTNKFFNYWKIRKDTRGDPY